MKPVYCFDINNSQLLGITSVDVDEERRIVIFEYIENDDSHRGFNENNLNDILEKYKDYKLHVVEKTCNIFTDYYEADVTFSDFVDECMEDRIDINFNN